MVESDHDMRNPAGRRRLPGDRQDRWLPPERLTRVHGIASVTGDTRPDGKPVKHASLAYMVSRPVGGVAQIMNNDFQQKVLDNTLQRADEMQVTIDSMEKMQQSRRHHVGAGCCHPGVAPRCRTR